MTVRPGFADAALAAGATAWAGFFLASAPFAAPVVATSLLLAPAVFVLSWWPLVGAVGVLAVTVGQWALGGTLRRPRDVGRPHRRRLPAGALRARRGGARPGRLRRRGGGA
ncbi:MAG: hypothetical protein ABS81_07620 [Pseudonocardia sp. SCN 72-86]|nr:MAG: hypothetical protein ABS81_07620 [Pseudonocardia sp. SCN 72-86]